MKTPIDSPQKEQNRKGGPEHFRGCRILLLVLLFAFSGTAGVLAMSAAGGEVAGNCGSCLESMDCPETPGLLRSSGRRFSSRPPRSGNCRSQARSDRGFPGWAPPAGDAPVLPPSETFAGRHVRRTALWKKIIECLPFSVRAGPSYPGR